VALLLPRTPAGVALCVFCTCNNRGTPSGVLGGGESAAYPQINLGVIHRLRLPAYRNAAIFRTRMGLQPLVAINIESGCLESNLETAASLLRK
jgi:hypothetical protein